MVEIVFLAVIVCDRGFKEIVKSVQHEKKHMYIPNVQLYIQRNRALITKMSCITALI